VVDDAVEGVGAEIVFRLQVSGIRLQVAGCRFRRMR
jgi:hypothetical protein